MNERLETKKKKPVAAEMPIHTINEGSVAALIWRRQSPSGYAYYDFSLMRSWQSLSSGNIGCSKNFFAHNQSELVSVIHQATQWITNHEAQGLKQEAAAA
jgi:hypothetical protein